MVIIVIICSSDVHLEVRGPNTVRDLSLSGSQIVFITLNFFSNKANMINFSILGFTLCNFKIRGAVEFFIELQQDYALEDMYIRK
jgi:hypothetical protein